MSSAGFSLQFLHIAQHCIVQSTRLTVQFLKFKNHTVTSIITFFNNIQPYSFIVRLFN